MTARILLIMLMAAGFWTIAAAPASAGTRPRVVMLGDSLTAGCDWQTRLNQAEVINQGISGDSTWSILARLPQVTKARPDLIFLQAGINDFGKKPDPEGILKRHLKIWSELREKLPQAELYIVSILPVSAKRYPRWGASVVQANLLLREAAEKNGLVFIDLYSKMSDQDGGLLKDLTYDGLHLRAPAYDLWLEAVRPYIDEAAAAGTDGGVDG